MRRMIYILRMRRETGYAERRVVQWSLLRIHLTWAYRGVPVFSHFAFPEHAACIAWRIEKGWVRLGFEHSAPMRVRAGSWVIPAQDKSRHDFSPDAIISSIRFKAHWPDNTPLFASTQSVMFATGRFGKLEQTTKQLLRSVAAITTRSGEKMSLLQESVALGAYLHVTQSMQHWFHAYADAMMAMGVPFATAGEYDPRVAQATQIIDEAPKGKRINEAELARSVGLSVSQLNRLFVATVGMTPRAYWEKRRLDFAREALLGTAMSVKEIAYQLGFLHSSHFSAWFRKKLWLYPSQFRITTNPDVTRVLG